MSEEAIYLTVDKVAKMFGVKPATVRDWIDKGIFPNAFKLQPGEQQAPWFIPTSDIEDLAQKRYGSD